MEIQNPNPPNPPLKPSLAGPSRIGAVQETGVRLPGPLGPEAQEYRMKLLQDLDLVQNMPIPELRARVEGSSLHGALQGYAQAESVPERRVWESRLRELSLRDTVLARAETSVQETDEKKKQSSWNDDLKLVGPPQENYSVHSLEDLLKLLKIKDDSPQAAALRNLTTKLWQHARRGPNIFGYLHEIAKDHGLAKLLTICQTLDRYMSEQWDSKGSVDIGELVEAALRDVAHPDGIGQDGKGTCAAASLQCKLAAEQPEQYVKMLTTLAAGKTYRAPGGQEIPPNQTWVGDDTDNRRVSEKIMQNAIMNLRGQPYDSKKDLSYKPDDEAGMTDAQIENSAEKLFGYRDNDFDNDQESFFVSKRDLWNYIQDDLARGRPVNVSFAGHAVLVTGFDPTQKPPVVLIATWGRSATMSLDNFLRHVVAVRTQDDSGLDNRELPRDKRTSVLDDAA